MATPAEEIKSAEEQGNSVVTEYDPSKNPDIISLIKQKDGNWKAIGQKNDKLIEIRGVKPEDCLIELLTSA